VGDDRHSTAATIGAASGFRPRLPAPGSCPSPRPPSRDVRPAITTTGGTGRTSGSAPLTGWDARQADHL